MRNEGDSKAPPFPLRYKPGGYDVLERLRRLYEERAQDIILATMDIPSPTQQKMSARYATGFCDYPDPYERAIYWDGRFREKIEVEDDSIPNAYLSEMDQGLYGGLLGGKARFLSVPEMGRVSSMVEPLLEEWSEFDRLPVFDPDQKDNKWLQRYLHQMQVFVEESRGNWAISHFVLIDGLNFAFELRGATETYLGVIDFPETVERIIDYAHDLNVNIQDIFFDAVPLVQGGTASTLAEWIPGRIVFESIDPFHMTSVDYFEEWGREPAERMMTHYDGGVIHIHGNGRHLLRAASTLKGMKAIWLGDDLGFPPVHSILDWVKKETGDAPLIVDNIDYEDFCRALDEHRLPGGVLYHVSGAPGVDAANRRMEQVRRYRL